MTTLWSVLCLKVPSVMQHGVFGRIIQHYHLSKRIPSIVYMQRNYKDTIWYVMSASVVLRPQQQHRWAHTRLPPCVLPRWSGGRQHEETVQLRNHERAANWENRDTMGTSKTLKSPHHEGYSPSYFKKIHQVVRMFVAFWCTWAPWARSSGELFESPPKVSVSEL
jgi:hypothetical protein